MMNKKLIIPTLVIITAAGILTLSVPKINAQTNDPMSGLVTQIAKKFNLDQSQVQTVVDQYRQEQKQTHGVKIQQKQTDRLEKLVTENKISEAQREAIITELAALKIKYNPENLKKLTPAERKVQRQNEQNELKAWAKAQGIDIKLLTARSGLEIRGK